MKQTVLVIGAGLTPTGRSVELIEKMRQADFIVTYHQMNGDIQGHKPDLVLIDDPVENYVALDFEDLERRIMCSEIYCIGHPDQLPPIRDSLGPHPCDYEREKPRNTAGMGPRNKWGKVK